MCRFEERQVHSSCALLSNAHLVKMLMVKGESVGKVCLG